MNRRDINGGFRPLRHRKKGDAPERDSIEEGNAIEACSEKDLEVGWMDRADDHIGDIALFLAAYRLGANGEGSAGGV